jgi:4-hydroxy-tetrahydrodipicolinate synthase
MTIKLEGVYVPCVTPFDAEGEVNFGVLGNLVEFWLDSGVAGIVVNASTGESVYLSREEQAETLTFVLDQVAGRAQVIAGTGAMATRETIEQTREAKEAGAEAALVTTPWFFRPSEDDLVRHYDAVLSAVDLPVILYNVPKFTGYSIAPRTVQRIAEQHSSLIGVKDSSGNPGNMAELARILGGKVTCLSGAADMVLPALSLGGKGAILAVANVIPRTCAELVAAYKEGDNGKASKRQHTLSHVNKVLVADLPQVAAIKATLEAMGYKAGPPRMPLSPLTEPQRKTAAEALKSIRLY